MEDICCYGVAMSAVEGLEGATVYVLRLLAAGGDITDVDSDAGREAMQEIVGLFESGSMSTGNVSEFQLAIDGLAGGQLVGAPYITHRFGLDDIVEAFATAEHVTGQDAIKVSIVY